MKRVLQNAGVAVIWIYFICFGLIAAPYFNWKYANDHGFWSWVFLGEIVATAKAAIWPYYVLTGAMPGEPRKPTNAAPRTLPHFRDSIIAIQTAFSKEPDSPWGSMPKQRFAEIVYYYKVALEHAEKVDAHDLQFMHPEAPKRFRDDYLAGLQLFCVGADTDDFERMNQGAVLINTWGTWYRLHRSSP